MGVHGTIALLSTGIEVLTGTIMLGCLMENLSKMLWLCTAHNLYMSLYNFPFAMRHTGKKY